MTTLIDKELVSVQLKPVWGATKTIVNYIINISNPQWRDNTYEVTCELRGLHSGQPELEVIKVLAHNNNEDTLIAESVADYCGWQYDGHCETEYLNGGDNMKLSELVIIAGMMLITLWATVGLIVIR